MKFIYKKGKIISFCPKYILVGCIVLYSVNILNVVNNNHTIIDKVGNEHPEEIISTIMVTYALIFTGIILYLTGKFKMVKKI